MTFAVIELNLRLPSMLHGKKGFQRVEWAFKNVLNKPTTWLFFDLGTESTGVAEGTEHNPPGAGRLELTGKPGDPTLKGNNPELIPCEPVLTTYDNIVTPSFSELNATTQSEQDLRDICGEVSEWLAMVSIRSRRVSATDNIDPYLCRYVAPEISDKAATATDLMSLKWGGLIPPHWIAQLFITLLYVLLCLPCNDLGRIC